MRQITSLLALMALVAALAGCSGSDGPGSDPGLDGRTFWSTEVMRGGNPVELVPGTRISVSFDKGNLGADAGCNSMGGEYSIDGGVLRVGDLFSTEMGCDPARHDQDRFVANFLTNSPKVEAAGNDLTLTTADVTIRFVDRKLADPDHRLIGTHWVTTGFIQGDAATSMPSFGEPAWLKFVDVSTMTGFDSCIHFDAAVEIDGEGSSGEVTFGELTSPDAAFTSCIVNDYMTAFNALFGSGRATWTIDGPALTMVGADGNGVTFLAS